MLYDMHIHTEFSRDSQADLEQYFIKAKKLGLDKICMTDHIDFEIPYYDYKDDSFDYERLKLKATDLSVQYDIKPIIGAEIGYRKSLHQRVDSLIKNSDFKAILFSVHQDDEYSFARISKSLSVEESIERYFNQLLDLVTSGLDFDIVTHIDFVFRYLEDKTLFYNYKSQYQNILKEVVKNDIVLEFNTASTLYFGNLDFYHFILEIYKELGGQNISLGSDSHEVLSYKRDFDQAIEIIKQHGFDYVILIDDRKREKVRI
jgi:histidinol-phosphatase (PHP family)